MMMFATVECSCAEFYTSGVDFAAFNKSIALLTEKTDAHSCA